MKEYDFYVKYRQSARSILSIHLKWTTQQRVMGLSFLHPPEKGSDHPPKFCSANIANTRIGN